MILQFKNKAIPNLDSQKSIILDYKKMPISSINNLLNEEFIDVLSIGIKGQNYYNLENNPPYNQSIPGSIKNLYLRKTVALKLLKVNDLLLKEGLELFVFDCYRPFTVQNYLWDVWAPNYIRERHPGITSQEIDKLKHEFTSQASNKESDIDLNAPPPHFTGAAVDLTIMKRSDEDHLFMGTIFDDFTKASYTDHYEQILEKDQLTGREKDALTNRRLLYWVMKDAGFENYPFEWWHFSWGDQMWAVLSNNAVAYYSYRSIFETQ